MFVKNSTENPCFYLVDTLCVGSVQKSCRFTFTIMKVQGRLMIIKKRIKHQCRVKLTVVWYVDQGLIVTREPRLCQHIRLLHSVLHALRVGN